ncbi:DETOXIFICATION 14-like protein [Tanacetum coccineum]
MLLDCISEPSLATTKFERKIMEKGLLMAERPWRSDYVLVEEVKRACNIALPMVVVMVSQNLLRVVSMSMVGHLGELELAGTAVATSLANVTGFSLLVMFLHLLYLHVHN